MAMSAAQYNAQMQQIANTAAQYSQDARGRTDPSSSVYRQPTDQELASLGSSSGGSSVTPSISPSGGTAVSPLQQYMDMALQISASNNAHSAKQAADLRAWQEEQTRLMQQYNSVEAAKNRDWQKMMSDTAHQREVQDLQAAGLNPILSASGGNGAAVGSGATASASMPSGAMGQTDTSANQAVTGLLTAFLSAQTQLEAQRVNAQANLAVADKYNSMSKYLGELQAETSITTHQIAGEYGLKQSEVSAAASKLVAEINRSGTISSAQIHAEASKYGAQLGLQGTQLASFTSAMASYAVAQVHSEASHYSADTSASSALSVAQQQGLNQLYSDVRSGGLSTIFSLIDAGILGHRDSSQVISKAFGAGTFGGSSRNGFGGSSRK